jgi:hypothetical protein
MAQRRNYWSNSALAGWIRGTPKPGSATMEGWDEWREQAQASKPIRYWMAEEGLDHIQNFIWWPVDQLYSIKYYINNRWISCTHALTAHPRDIRPGTWHDVGQRMMPCLFNELVDFVEIEQAGHHVAWDQDARKRYSPPWWARGWFRWRTWRCPEAGLDYLNWSASLKFDDEWVAADDPKYNSSTPQAVAAQEIIDLYTWWTQVYRNRPDPYEASGWTAACEAEREANGGTMNWGKRSAAFKSKSDQAHELLCKIEAQYDQEDDDMLIRLIRVRRALWT